MTSRRRFLTAMMATGLAPLAGWADLGLPAFLSAGQDAEGQNWLAGIGEGGQIRFRLPLPARGHAAAAHPTRPHAVGFARRPGRFAFVLECTNGTVLARLTPPEGRHFYGHGVFSRDGAWLYTTENDFDAARGGVGVWDVNAGYARAGAFDSHGVGPHQIALMPDGDTLVVANGGIETHPDSGRAKLNLPVMQPNLSYLSRDGALLDQTRATPDLRLNSIRHLDVRADGLVAVALQWQGGQATRPPILALHRRGQPLQMLGGAQAAQMNGYGGSVVFARDGARVAVSSPRGGQVQLFDADTGAFLDRAEHADICGLGAGAAGFVATTGQGQMITLDGSKPIQTALRWDNHLIALRP